MKYCINYYTSCPCIAEVQEITIKYSKGKDLVAFIEEHQDKRVNIYTDEPTKMTDTDWNLVTVLCSDKEKNCVAKIDYNKDLIKTFVDHKCRFFINEICTTWEKVYEHLSYGVTDVYVGNDLGFYLPEVSELIHQCGAQVRVFPNVAQCDEGYNPKLWAQFFIRPEDLESELISSYIDTVEFYGDMDKQHILFLVYHKQQQWFGDLKDLIINLNISIDNRSLDPTFIIPRVNCKRKCIKGGRCRICSTQLKMAEASSRYGMYYSKKKHK